MNLEEIQEEKIYGIYRKAGLDKWIYRNLSVPAEVLAIQPDQSDFSDELEDVDHLIRWGNGHGPTILIELKGYGVSSPIATIGTVMIIQVNHIRLPIEEMVDPKVLCPPTDKVLAKFTNREYQKSTQEEKKL